MTSHPKLTAQFNKFIAHRGLRINEHLQSAMVFDFSEWLGQLALGGYQGGRENLNT